VNNNLSEKLRKKLVKNNGFSKINAIRPKIKARRGRMKKFKLGLKVNWGGSHAKFRKSISSRPILPAKLSNVEKSNVWNIHYSEKNADVWKNMTTFAA
jgi:hypothetical protein